MVPKVAKKAGRVIPPGPRATVDWERVEKEELLVGQHAYDDHELTRAQQHFTRRKAIKEAEGDWRGAQKAQRQLNYAVEGKLAIRSSWCPTCMNYLHRCKCEVETESPQGLLVLQLIHNILREPTQSVEEERARRKAMKKAEAKAKRKAKKEA